MDPRILSALITAGAMILVALIGKMSLPKIKSYRIRRKYSLPDITKTIWEANWYFEDGTLYVSDQVTFKKWTRTNLFSGYGEVTHGNKQYKYSIEGEMSPKGIVVLTYKAEKFPTEAPIGMACLELSDNAENLEGYWSGRARGDIKYGKVKMRKIGALS
ncbi:MAG: hypothetical protein ACFFB3_19285 [Candidatus Hodarchaeota archaeon]